MGVLKRILFVFTIFLFLAKALANPYSLVATEKKITLEKPYKNVEDVFYFGESDNPLRS